jgi:hypothetical protein
MSESSVSGDVHLATVAKYRNPLVAEAARNYLESHGVRVFLADAELVNMDWFLLNAVGQIKLQVASSDAATAGELLSRLPAGRPDSPESAAESEATVCLACGAGLSEEQTTCPACGWSYAS